MSSQPNRRQSNLVTLRQLLIDLTDEWTTRGHHRIGQNVKTGIEVCSVPVCMCAACVYLCISVYLCVFDGRAAMA